MSNGVTTNTVEQGTIPLNQAKRVRKEMDVDDLDNTDFDIKSMLLALSAKMDTLHDSMSAIDIRLNNKIDNRMQAVISDVDQRLVHAIDNHCWRN